jgi:hypothetical protein
VPPLAPSSYSIKFSAAQEHLNKVNLRQGREIFQPAAEPEQEDMEPGLLLTQEASRSRQPQQQPKRSEQQQQRSMSPTGIPLVKRKALIVDGNNMKAALLRGVLAVKVSYCHIMPCLAYYLFYMLQYGRSGQPKKKLVRYDEQAQRIEWSSVDGSRASFSSLFGNSSNKSKEVSAIAIDAICEVCKGVKTEVLRKAGLVDPNCCLSIVTADRTLDLAFACNADRDSVLRGLRSILQEYPKPVKFI